MNRIQTFFRRPARAILAATLAAAALLTACKAKTDEEILRAADMQVSQRNILSATLQLKDFIKKRPKSPNIQIARMKLAQCYFLDRDYDKSRALLDEVVTTAGGRGTELGLNAVSLKLDTYAQESKFKEALDEALLTSPSLRGMDAKYSNFFMMRTAELFLNTARTTEALQTFAALLEQPKLEDEYSLNAVRVSARIRIGANQNDKAIAIYDGYIKKHPDAPFNFILRRDLAQLYAHVGNKELSKTEFDEAEKIIKTKIDEALGAEKKSSLLFELADTYFAQERKDEGRAALRRVIDEFPTGKLRGQAMLMLAETFNQDGDIETALDQLGKVAQAFPGSQEAMIAARRSQEIRSARAKAGATTGTAMTADPVTTATAKTADTATTATAAQSGRPGEAGAPADAGTTGASGKSGDTGVAGEAAKAGEAGKAGADGPTEMPAPAPKKAKAKKK